MLTTEQLLAILSGTGYTIIITVVAICLGVVLGMLMALARISPNKILNKLSWIYVWFFRGTPLLLQLYIIHFAFPIVYNNITGAYAPVNPLISCFIAFSLNSTAYLAEFFRGGIQSIDKGQIEAARALGMSYNQTMYKIIIPQSIKRLIPSVGNEVIMLIKDTSLASTVSLFDLLRQSKVLTNSTGNIMFYVYAAVIYLVMTSIIQVVFDKLEKKVGVYE